MLSDSLLDLSHLQRESNSTFYCFISLCKSVSFIKKHVSFAFIMVNIKSETLQMSFIEIMKRRGTRN